MSNPTPIVAGIDTAKDKLDIAVHAGELHLTVENQPSGYKVLSKALFQAGVSRVGIEASGGYERGVIAHLHKAGFEVFLLQPLQMKAFARLHLKRAKNDKIDAALIAACTAMLDPRARHYDPRIEPLSDALTFIEQTEEDIIRAKTRLEKTHLPHLRRKIEADIKRLEIRRTAELARIEQSICQEEDLKHRFELLKSIPTVGARTGLAILLRIPELGSISDAQAAALAGLAPFDHDSGKYKGERHIAGGRARLRRSLYLAALPGAFRWNPALRAFYQRLIGKGKPHKVALVAVARKLLTFANAVLTRGTPWVEKTARA
jgi:transposase